MTAQLLPPVTMPQLSGGRERARALLAPIDKKIRGQRVRLDCRRLVAGTLSFADELVTIALVSGGAGQLVVEHAGDEFARYILEAAKDHGVADRISFP